MGNLRLNTGEGIEAVGLGLQSSLGKQKNGK